MRLLRPTLKRLPSLIAFVLCVSAFFVTMATVKASDEAAEAECKAMVREAMRSYPALMMQVIDDCAGFNGSVQDVPPMMRLY
jgi:hypothetical protein